MDLLDFIKEAVAFSNGRFHHDGGVFYFDMAHLPADLMRKAEPLFATGTLIQETSSVSFDKNAFTLLKGVDIQLDRNILVMPESVLVFFQAGDTVLKPKHPFNGGTIVGKQKVV